MIFIRLRDGVAMHFNARLSEWLMLFPTAGMWAALHIQPEMFAVSPSFTHVASWASENTWAAIIFVCGVSRAAALIINGTFDEFRYSPHLRCGAAAICALLWSQFSLGFFYAYWSHGGALVNFMAFTSLTIFELANFYRSSRDVGTTYAELKRWRAKNGLGL